MNMCEWQGLKYNWAPEGRRGYSQLTAWSHCSWASLDLLRVKPLQLLVHILSPVIDNCPSRISWRECITVEYTGKIRNAATNFFISKLFSPFLQYLAGSQSTDKLCWTLIFTLRIFHTCELFARILHIVWRTRSDSSQFSNAFVTYVWRSIPVLWSFIGSMNANSSHCSKYP